MVESLTNCKSAVTATGPIPVILLGAAVAGLTAAYIPATELLFTVTKSCKPAGADHKNMRILGLDPSGGVPKKALFMEVPRPFPS